MSDILEDLEIFTMDTDIFHHRDERKGYKKYNESKRENTIEKDMEIDSTDSFVAKAFGKSVDKVEKSEAEELVKAEKMENCGSKETFEKKNCIEENAKAEVSEETEDKEEKRRRYDESGLDERILRAVSEMGFEYMSPIQEAAIPVMMSGRDIIGQAQTGTGKTAAFGIPVLERVDSSKKELQAVILCPTRELAMQAADDIRDFAKYMHGIKVLSVYGGQDIMRQIRALSGGVQIVVGTPGRVMDHMRRHTMKMETVKTLVLDEADEMLDMGFRDDIETILQGMPEERQTALFSATMPKPILEITRQYQKSDAEYIRMTPKEITTKSIEQSYFVIPRNIKFEVLCRLIDFYQPKRSLIFANTKRMVDELATKLKDKGYEADGLHGDLSQNQRDMVMNTFRKGTINILIATDVAARGIDVSGVDCVFNFDIPEDIEYYVHRIGRTGRAGKSGRSFTLVSGREMYKLRDIERICHTKIEERKVPSAKDITRAKSQKIFAEVIDVLENGNIDSTLNFVMQKIEEGEYTAEQLAAGFMRLKMGDDLEDLKIEDERRNRHRDRGRMGSRFGREGRGRFDKEGRGRFDRDGKERRGGRDRKRFGDRDRFGDKERLGKDHGAKRFGRVEDKKRENRDSDRRGKERRVEKNRGFGKVLDKTKTKEGRLSSRERRGMRVERSEDRFFGGVAIKTRGADGKFHKDGE